ncbi:SGNH/GDSL hydrolase family protein, partial [Streptomyces sp. NPDC059755]|uniref:SGNH/GDSL hydrolase family protein n=1 Tax=Streptomyces sp. NPDC059755 TaxID=3346934 RepID=UPI003655E60A
EFGRPGRSGGAGFYEYDEEGRRTRLWPGLREHFTRPGADIPFEDMKERMLLSEALDAVGRNSDLVTVQIGGNDMGFGSIIGTCAQLSAQDPTGNPCQRHYGASGVDQLTVAIARTGPKVARVLQAVHDRAPHARILVVGYPDLLPDDGSGCAPSVPFATQDFPYLRDTGKRLNLMLRLVARWNHAEYVDTYGPTIGHDMCKPPAERWIEPLQPTSPAAPAHPNAKGEAAMAGAVWQRLTHGRGGH